MLWNMPMAQKIDQITYDPETIVWISRVSMASGGFVGNSKALADALIIAIKSKAYNDKIIWLLPLLGNNLAAARVPLRDRLGVGIATNMGFTDGDFSQNTGLQGTGAAVLDTLIRPSQLGISNCGGIGYWETKISFAGNTSELIGCANNPGPGSQGFGLFATATVQGFEWGQSSGGGEVDYPFAGTNGHYYGQRKNATLREFYREGSVVATDTVNNSTTAANISTIALLGVFSTNILPGPRYWAGRCAVAYMTDGTMGIAEAADFNNLLKAFLLTPTGRA